MFDVNIRRDEQLLCGRLVAMPPAPPQVTEQSADSTWGYRNVISIDFPAMPDVIELARSTEYMVSTSLPVPDGIHVYKATKPLEIPISFKIHSFDKQYCKQGAKSLLQLAARLHSFVLPISTYSRGITIAPLAPKTTSTDNGGQANTAKMESVAQQNLVYTVQGADNAGVGGIFAPVTCWLHLMWIAEDQPGISAVGYVKEVNVKFNGPWLRGPVGSFNLPTSADFSFVFIHRPGHGNAMRYESSAQFPELAESGQAYADDVKNKLFNTRDLVYSASSPGYQGFQGGSFTEGYVPPPEPTARELEIEKMKKSRNFGIVPR
jgi:hypothetical protein